MGLEAVIFIFIGLVAVVLNSVEIHFTSKKMHALKPHDQLVLSLACSDLLNGLYSITFGIYGLTVQSNIDRDVVLLVAAFNFTSLNLLAIGYDRFIAIRFPIKHHMKLTEKRMKIAILVMWFGLLVFVILIPVILAMTGIASAVVSGYLAWLAKDWTVWFGSTMTAHYIAIIIITLKRRAKLNNQSSLVEARATKREITLIWICIFSFGYYIASAFPFTIHLMITLKPSLGLACLLLTNTIVNPIVYLVKAYKDDRQRGQVEATMSINKESARP